MQISSVTAHNFGPLRGETLLLAQGMTVVVGDNESAKSSWHAAVYAAVCGRRRGRGRPQQDEQRFIDLHKPWDHDDWLVTAEVVLDDGRRIEFRHDLAGKVDCHAKDLDLGRDVSDEIMNDGAPDGARWLGLDRASFAATACVQQAQLLRVLHQADGLQEHLQRAAATAGTDATAAAALDCLEEFSRDHVGLDRANSSKPLRRAILRLGAAEQELAARRRAHEEYVSRLERVDGLRERARCAAALLEAHEAAAARHSADHALERARRAAQLAASCGDQPPPSALQDDALARQVTEALSAWKERPHLTPPPDQSSEQLQGEIDDLPAAPDGDLEPHPSVSEATVRVQRAEAQHQLHQTTRPSDELTTSPRVEARDDELLDLARTLELALPSIAVPLIDRERTARAAVQGPRRPAMLVTLGGVLLLLLGVVLAVVVSPGLGSLALLGAAVAVAATLRRRHDESAATTELIEAQAQLQAARTEVAEATRRHEQAVARCAQLGTTADPARLRSIAVAQARAETRQRDEQTWTEQHGRLQTELHDAITALAGALHARGHRTSGADLALLLTAAAQYQDDCRERAEQARRSARRPDLQQQLTAARAAENQAAAEQQRRAQAAEAVIAAAQACQVPADTTEETVPRLEQYLTERNNRLRELSTAQKNWAELHALLDGQSLAELQRTAAQANDMAGRLIAAADSELLAQAELKSASELTALREAASNAQSAAAAAEGELRQFSVTVGSVAEAEEALDEAGAELHRVRELDQTLQLARRFLEEAQTRVHRNIAPVLAGSVKQWLPKVTDGRYTDVMVDPYSLQVQVCGPTPGWDPPDRLSYGTAEQVYLLLRIALTDQLTNGHDTCPLLLDDVTVHADAQRTRDILELLLEVAAQRQVVLFTQEEQVADWAQQRLTGPRHAVRQLTIVPSP